MNIAWANDHGITDLASSHNPFNATAAGATWQYTLDSSIILVARDAFYQYFKGLSEASQPIDAWRQLDFDDSSWSMGQAPFYYDQDNGPPPNPAYTGNTLLSDMQNNYTVVYLRTKFVVDNPDAVTNLTLRYQNDDGFIAWINGVEIGRSHVPSGDVPYNATAQNNPEPLPTIIGTLPDPASLLVPGTNVFAIQAVNQAPSSSDLLVDFQLSAVLADPSVVAPHLLSVNPSAGNVFYLTNITVTFSEPVRGVDAGDLLVNGVPAAGISGGSSNVAYTFSFPQPAYGTVAITWSADPGIMDFDATPKPFDDQAPGTTWQYNLLNPNAPVVVTQQPLGGTTVNALTQIQVTFSKSVTGVDAADLLINGIPATGRSGSGSSYTFTFPQPAYGAVTIGWVAGHGIQDTDVPPNVFDPSRAGSTWQYTLIDRTPPAIASQNPPANATVTNLTQLQVTFTESVSGVDASDLLINGMPATGVSGSGASYTFTFGQPNATVVNVTWAPDHGISDLAQTPNAFDAMAPVSTWQYETFDDVPPRVAEANPPPFATVRSLPQLVLTFTEPVAGLDATDLLINGIPAQSVSGSAAGPYTFDFVAPTNGTVEVQWASGHGIHDLANPPNAFAGGEWTYTVDPNASFAGKVVINEIMFHPTSQRTNDEWIELHNLAPEPVNLSGWSFTKGVSFTFPNATLPVDGYLVIAADTAAFRANYPGVNNVIGDWIGQLSNYGETIEISDALGEKVDSVTYADSGDWGVRMRGDGEDHVISLTRNGSTVTVVCPGTRGNGDRVTIYGADQPEYNVTNVAISGSSLSGFTYSISGTPSSPATGEIICRTLTDYGHTGWGWSCHADGLGSSFELVNPVMPNQYGQNWKSSAAVHGTPGQPNSVLAPNAPPLVLDMRHFPAIPQPSDTVTVTAHLLDERTNGVTATLFWRVDETSGTGTFTSVPMYDDGQHNDGIAGDQVFGGQIPPQAANTVVEFYVQARDLEGQTRTWPAAAMGTDFNPIQEANALYQVDDPNLNFVGTIPQPTYRLIMRWADRSELWSYPGSANNCNARMNGTFISADNAGTEVRYLAGFRNRGAGTRNGGGSVGGTRIMNYQITVPSDTPLQGVDSWNLNFNYTHAQYVGYVLSLLSGLHAEQGGLVHLAVNNSNPSNSGSPQYGSYMRLESSDRIYPTRHFPTDADGNLYRGQSGGHQCTLSYLGDNWRSYANAGYSKQSNRSENDWTDLINLTAVLNTNAPDDAVFAQAVRQVVNVDEWMRYFAVFTIMLSRETSLATGQGDDFTFYRGVEDSRFQLLAHDFDTILNQGDTTGGYTDSIFRMTALPAAWMTRFMHHPDFVPSYYRELKRLSDTVFAPANLDPLLDQLLTGFVPQTTIDAMKSFSANRTAYILSQIPTTITINTTLGQSSGHYYTTSPSTTLSGRANVIDTHTVLVNGNPATWSAWEGQWTANVSLQPGLNQVLVQTLNTNNVEFERGSIEIWYDDGSMQNVSGTLSGNVIWTPSAGPFNVTGPLTVGSGATLAIQPGTTVYLASGASITVSGTGRLLAEGTDVLHIRFTSVPGGGNWGSLDFINATAESRLAYVDFDSCGGTTIGGHNAQLHVNDGIVFIDHCTWPSTPVVEYISFDHSSFIVQNCIFPSYPPPSGPESLHGINGIPATGYGIFRDNYFGHTWGFNDTIDFTGGQRPGAILQFINNVFDGASDDNLDLDSTDAWIEGNIFMHVHRDPNRTDNPLDTASAISGGVDFANQFSEWTIINNLFYDVDHAILNKGGSSAGAGRFVFVNNTLVHVNKDNGGGSDSDIAAFDFTDDEVPLPDPRYGAGAYIAGNIIWDCPRLTANYNSANLTVIFENNILPEPWTGPGTNNVVVDPHLNLDLITDIATADWRTVKAALTPRAGSPALGTGIGGFDKGGLHPDGLLIFGEPASTTPSTSATLTVAPGGAFYWGSVVPPYDWGYTHYKWKLDNGSWSAAIAISNSPTIHLTNLANGSHTVYVTGQNDAGYYQDDTFAYPTTAGIPAHVTASRTWTVNTYASPLRLNEILAANRGAVVHAHSTPDVIELYNDSDATVDLSGVQLSDDPSAPDKFVFPPGATMSAREYLVVYADNYDGTPGYHTGFNLAQSGEGLYLL